MAVFDNKRYQELHPKTQKAKDTKPKQEKKPKEEKPKAQAQGGLNKYSFEGPTLA